MKNLNRLNNFNFAFLASLVIIAGGLVLAISVPTLRSWQYSNIDNLISEAKTSNNPEVKIGLLSQAALLGKNDPIATETYAHNLWQAGEYTKAIGAYEDSLLKINPNFLGNLALKAGYQNKAKAFFEKSSAAGENDEAYSGLAIVEYINGNTSKGCEYSNKASKLNLSSPRAEQAKAICNILQTKSGLITRQQAYTILNAYMYEQALDALQKTTPKNTTDWLAIGRIHANRGDLNAAIDSLKSAHNQSPERADIITQLIGYLKAASREGEAQVYTERLNELQFKNYQ